MNTYRISCADVLYCFEFLIKVSIVSGRDFMQSLCKCASYPFSSGVGAQNVEQMNFYFTGQWRVSTFPDIQGQVQKCANFHSSHTLCFLFLSLSRTICSYDSQFLFMNIIVNLNKLYLSYESTIFYCMFKNFG